MDVQVENPEATLARITLTVPADEFQGELRRNFDRDVARALLPHVPSRTFAVSNMAGRIEPGALVIEVAE